MAEYNTEIRNNDVMPIAYAVINEDSAPQIAQLFMDSPIKCCSDSIECDGRQLRIKNSGNKSYFLFPPAVGLSILRK